MAVTVDPDWWKTLFDEIYLLTDARSVCDGEITRREIDLICGILPMRPEHRVLDLCGGHGRHSLELCSRGYRGCVLLDYSPSLLSVAQAEALARDLPVRILRADARNTALVSESFDHVLILGNSLGYAGDDRADRQVLGEAFRVLRPGGWVLLDLADGDSLRDSFNPEGWFEIGGDWVVCRRRHMEGDRVSVREVVLSKEKGLVRDRSYSIRFHDARSAAALLVDMGFADVQVVRDFVLREERGDYGFMRQRMLAVGQKTGKPYRAGGGLVGG